MSYYILPKIKNNIIFETNFETNLKNENEIISTRLICQSLIYYLNLNKKQLEKLYIDENGNKCFNIEQLTKIINPYEYIFTKLPNSKYSVSKLKPYSNVFYDLLEIVNTLTIFDNFESKSINSIHYGENSNSTIECINMLREFNNDKHIGLDNIIDNNYEKNSIDFLFYEIKPIYTENINDYIKEFIKILLNIFFLQNIGGISIIKIDNLFYKQLIELIYILCNVYEKIYIFKPNTSNILQSEKYIICKNYIIIPNLLNYINNLQKILNQNNINNIIKNGLQYFFINKIEEINIIMGQQQLIAMDQLISIIKNKNKDEKIEAIKKINIQKCILWCEKYKIPSNKLNDRINIFLPLIKIEKEEASIEEDTELLYF